ncbi:MAG TPA: hypothetical protein VJ650_15040 [Gemmatimonadaceae bacterium]|nr:hypothetical protein [Gemmatimonadaceae bacterium]
MRARHVLVAAQLVALCACVSRPSAETTVGDDLADSPELATLAALRLDFPEPHVNVALVDTLVRALPEVGPFNPRRFPSPTRLSPHAVAAVSGQWRFIPSGFTDTTANTDTTRIVLGRVATCARGERGNCAQVIAFVAGRPFSRNSYALAELRRSGGRWIVTRVTYHHE